MVEDGGGRGWAAGGHNKPLFPSGLVVFVFFFVFFFF